MIRALTKCDSPDTYKLFNSDKIETLISTQSLFSRNSMNKDIASVNPRMNFRRQNYS